MRNRVLTALACLLSTPLASALEIRFEVTEISYSLFDPTPGDGIPAFVSDGTGWTLEQFMDKDALVWQSSVWKDFRLDTGAPENVLVSGTLVEGATLEWTIKTRLTVQTYNDPGGGEEVGDLSYEFCTRRLGQPTPFDCIDQLFFFSSVSHDGSTDTHTLVKQYSFSAAAISGPPAPLGLELRAGFHVNATSTAVRPAIPEPSTGMLLLGGVALLGWLATRKHPRLRLSP